MLPSQAFPSICFVYRFRCRAEKLLDIKPVLPSLTAVAHAHNDLKMNRCSFLFLSPTSRSITSTPESIQVPLIQGGIRLVRFSLAHHWDWQVPKADDVYKQQPYSSSTCLRLILFCICPPLCAGVLWPMPAWVWRDVRSVCFLFFVFLHAPMQLPCMQPRSCTISQAVGGVCSSGCG